MKRNLLLIVAFLILIASNIGAQNPIPNNGFEGWTGGDPDLWATNNSVTIFISQATPGHSGSYAARGDVQQIFGFNVPPLLISSGNGFTVSQGYSTLYFYYKFNQVGTSNLVVTANFYNNDGSDAGYGVALISNPATGFTLGTAPIIITGNPVRCIISVTIADPQAGFPQSGNYFIIDDLSFDNSIGIPSVANENYFMSLPVPDPASNNATISFNLSKPTNVELKIYDLLGKQVLVQQINSTNSGTNIIDVDVRNLNSGNYLAVLNSEFGMLQRELVIAH